MSIIQIIVFGLFVNIISSVVMGFIIAVYSLFKNKFDPKYMQEILYIQVLYKKYYNLKKECSKKNISSITHESFIIFIPFASVLLLLEVIVEILRDNINVVTINKLEENIEKLEAKLEKYNIN